MIKNEQLELFPELIKYIYESPDGGKTVTRRPFGKDGPKEKILYEDMGDGHLIKTGWVKKSFDTYSPYNDRWKNNERT